MFKSETFSVISDRPDSWLTLEPIIYEGARQVFIVPAGFKTDFASVPQVFTWLIPRYGTYTRAAILHDYLCRPPAPVTRADADGIFRRVLGELGVSTPRRYMMWAAVRARSGMSNATAKDWTQFLATAIPSIVFLILPLTVVWLWTQMFKAVEWISLLITGLEIGRKWRVAHLLLQA